MTRYLFIETRDPFASRDTQFIADAAAALQRQGNEVTVFLVQNGVLAARRGVRGSPLEELAGAGVTLLPDDFSLKERGIHVTELAHGIRDVNLAALVDLLVQENTKAIWH